jgi:hypothetical protein
MASFPAPRRDAIVIPAEELVLERTPSGARLTTAARRAFALNDVSAAIAETLQRPILLTGIERRVLAEFDVDPAECSAAVRGFLQQLEAAGVLAVHEHRDAALRRQYLDLLARALVNLIYPEQDLRIDELEEHRAELFHLHYERRMRDLRYLEAEKFAAIVQHKIDGSSWRRRPARFAHTMVGLRRLDNLEYCAASVFANGIAGDFVECGVLQGGASIFLRGLQVAYGEEARRTWLCDSFAGPPPPQDAADRELAAGYNEAAEPWLAATIDAVRDNFRTYDLLSDNVRFVEGLFADALPHAEIERIAILRIDAGLYDATTDVLENLYDRISAGGFVVVDDYNVYEPCRRAVDDFRARRGDAAPMRIADWNSAYWQKPV